MSHTATEGEKAEALEEALQQVTRMADLVDSLLTLARADEGRFDLYREPIELASLAREVVETAKLLGEDASLTIEKEHLDDAIRHHLDVYESARNYDPRKAGIDKDLRLRLGPIEPVLARVDPLLRAPIRLNGAEFEALVAFVRDGLLDERATRDYLCPLIPASVPSGYPVMHFQECR